MRLLLALVRVLLVLLVCLVLLRVTGSERGTWLTLAVGALPLTLLPAYPALLLAAVARDRVLAGLSAVVVVAHVLVLVPALGAVPLPPLDAPRLRVVVANLYVLNPDPAEAGARLRALRPDVVVVPELTPAGLEGLRSAGLLDDLPHAVTDRRPGQETVGLLSRLPLRDVVLARGGGRVLPEATVTVEGRDVRLLSVHTLPPVSLLERLWRVELADLAQRAARTTLPLVVLGDTNADRDHAAFRALLDQGLRDAHDERGRGLARTWPAPLPLLHLDHVLVRDGRGAGVEVAAVREHRLPGTDHLAVVADLVVLARLS